MMKRHLTKLWALALALMAGNLCANAAPLARTSADWPKGDANRMFSISPVETHVWPQQRVPDERMSGSRLFQALTPERLHDASLSVRAASLTNLDRATMMGQVRKAPDGTLNAFYKLPKAAEGGFTKMFESTKLYAYGGTYDDEACTFTGVFCDVVGSTFSGGSIDKINYETGELISSVNLPWSEIELVSFARATDPNTGWVYGAFWAPGAQSIEWARVKYDTKEHESIRTLDTYTEMPLLTVCTDKGQFYCILDNSLLVKVDKLTGEFTEVGNVEVPLTYALCGATIDENTMVTYAVADDASSTGLFSVDLNTAETSLITTFSNVFQVYNLHIPVQAGLKCPSAPTLKISAPDGTMTVDYEIVIPNKLVDGTPVAGALDWEISVDGEVMFEGRNQAGSSITGNLAVGTPGVHVFVARAKNADGYSDRTTVRLFVGNGIPSAPATVNAGYANGTMTISWGATTTSADGGYINPGEVTYDLKLGDEVIAADLTEPTYSYSFPAPEERTAYIYTVVAKFAGLVSSTSTSNRVWLGNYPVPFTTLFDYDGVFDDYGYTVINANNDNRKWEYYTNTSDGITYKVARITFNNRYDADDWLITPNVKLEAGKYYSVTVTVFGSNRTNSTSASYREKFEVKAGRGVTVEDMTQQVIAPTEISNSWINPETHYGLIYADETGAYNVGVHGISAKNHYSLHLSELTVSDGMDADAPQKADDLTLTPNADGTLDVKGSFKAPTTTITGSPLSGQISFELKRGEDVVKTLKGNPGATISFTDKVPVKGSYEYTVTPIHNDLRGVGLRASAYIGPYAAAVPAKANVIETVQPGTVTVMWHPVTADVKGNTIKSANVKYQVYRVDMSGKIGEAMLEEPTSDTYATFKVIGNDSGQTFAHFVVTAFNRDSESAKTCLSNLIPIGKSYDMPLKYSSMNDANQYILGYNLSRVGTMFGYSSPTFQLITDEDADITSADGDGEFFGISFDTEKSWVQLYTGKVNLTEATNPELSFYVYRVAPDDNTLYEVYITRNGYQKLLGTVDSTDQAVGWNKVRFHLDSYIGSDIQVTLKVSAGKYIYAFFDKIMVKETLDRDMLAMRLETPTDVNVNEKYPLNVLVRNDGYLTADNYTVELYRDGDLLDTYDGKSLEPDGVKVITFEDQITYFDDNPLEAVYSAEIIYDNDRDPDNNLTSEVSVLRKVPSLPAVTDLSGEVTEEGTKLSWSTFSPGVLESEQITDDFESYTPWVQELDGWTFIDRDQSPITYVTYENIPNLVPEVSCASFVLFSYRDVGDYKPNSGTQALASIARYDDGQVDDWAILPRLCGREQTISFYARSGFSGYDERVEIWIARDDTVDPDKFEYYDVAEVESTTSTKFEFTLPEGTIRVALRSCAEGGFILVLDDVTYTPDPYLSVPKLAGYDVYRDGGKINESVVNAGEYIDAEMPAGKHTYHVVGKFDKGDSELSNGAVVELSGLVLTTASAKASVKVDGSDILVTGANQLNVAISGVDGRQYYTGIGDCRVTVAPGVYLIAVGDCSFKVIVK